MFSAKLIKAKPLSNTNKNELLILFWKILSLGFNTLHLYKVSQFIALAMTVKS